MVASILKIGSFRNTKCDNLVSFPHNIFIGISVLPIPYFKGLIYISMEEVSHLISTPHHLTIFHLSTQLVQ